MLTDEAALMAQGLDQALREFFVYEPDSGAVLRRSDLKEAGWLTVKGYRSIRFRNLRLWTHRVVWFLNFGRWPEGLIDHKNLNRADNRIDNLRDVTKKTNNQNSFAARRDSSSGYLGVHRSTYGVVKPWSAAITANGKRTNLGHFDTPEEASRVYLEAKMRLHDVGIAAPTHPEHQGGER